VFQGAGAPVPTVKMRKVFSGELNAGQVLSFELKRKLLEYFPGRVAEGPSKWKIDLRRLRVEIDAVLSLLKKVPGPFSASFLFFTRNNRQIMLQNAPESIVDFVTYSRREMLT
jgi:hypothetical protein